MGRRYAPAPTQIAASEAALPEGAADRRFGGVWTAVIVAQVAVTVAFEPGVVGVGFVDKLPRTTYLSLRIALDDAPSVASPRRSTTIAYVDPSSPRSSGGR